MNQKEIQEEPVMIFQRKKKKETKSCFSFLDIYTRV